MERGHPCPRVKLARGNPCPRSEMRIMESTKMTPEMESLKDRLRSTWIAGDFSVIAKSIEIGAEEFVARLDLKPGMSVLDVATGTGNLALPAA